MEAGAPGAGFPLSRASLRRPAIVSSPSAPRRPTFAPLTLLSSLKDQYQPLLLLELLVALKIPCLARAVGTALAGKEILLSLLAALERKPRPASVLPSNDRAIFAADDCASRRALFFPLLSLRRPCFAWRLAPPTLPTLHSAPASANRCE